MVDYEEIRDAYGEVKSTCRNDWCSDAASRAIIHFAVTSLQFLSTECKQIALTSLVPNKKYMSFSRGDIVTRPANYDSFVLDPEKIARDWQSWRRTSRNTVGFGQMLYTVALAPCLAMELFDRNNKKGPATYFECMIGHLFAKSLGIQPTRQAELSASGHPVRMTMDFLFETAGNTPDIHLPVKMSTRERVVQAWAHQRLLDSAYGEGRYKGIMVVFSETKLGSRSHEVVEICVPDQWLVYQSLLSRMERIYYFDMPVRYQELTDEFPSVIQIKPFQEFFTEITSLANH